VTTYERRHCDVMTDKGTAKPLHARRLLGILMTVMSMCKAHAPTAILTAFLALLIACTTGQPTVIEKLDALTAVTVTYCRTPLVMAPDTDLVAQARADYLQLGVLEINQMGALRYYLWLGITEVSQVMTVDNHPQGFDSIVLSANDESIELAVTGWTPGAIGTSEPVYHKLFPDSEDAYYQVTLEQIQLLTHSDNLKLRTTGPAPKEFISRYSQTTFEGDLAEFLSTVRQ